MERLIDSHQVEVVWHSYQLRPPGSPPMPEHYRQRIEAGQDSFNQMAKRDYGLDIVRGPFDIDSRPSLIVEKFAEQHGKGKAYHKATVAAYWSHARDISDPAVLKELAAQVGLSTDDFEAVLSSAEYEQQVEMDIQQAYQLGLRGVPALIFERKYLVSGAQPYDVLVNVVEQIQNPL